MNWYGTIWNKINLFGIVHPDSFIQRHAYLVLMCSTARYMDGERLTPKDEQAVVDRLLAHHPHSEDKIGCGLDSIMVSFIPVADEIVNSISLTCFMSNVKNMLIILL